MGAAELAAKLGSVQEDVATDSEFRALFTNRTKSIVWGMQPRAVQSMLDFDFVCSRKAPSVVAMIYPFV